MGDIAVRFLSFGLVRKKDIKKTGRLLSLSAKKPPPAVGGSAPGPGEDADQDKEEGSAGILARTARMLSFNPRKQKAPSVSFSRKREHEPVKPASGIGFGGATTPQQPSLEKVGGSSERLEDPAAPPPARRLASQRSQGSLAQVLGEEHPTFLKPQASILQRVDDGEIDGDSPLKEVLAQVGRASYAAISPAQRASTAGSLIRAGGGDGGAEAGKDDDDDDDDEGDLEPDSDMGGEELEVEEEIVEEEEGGTDMGEAAAAQVPMQETVEPPTGAAEALGGLSHAGSGGAIDYSDNYSGVLATPLPAAPVALTGETPMPADAEAPLPPLKTPAPDAPLPPLETPIPAAVAPECVAPEVAVAPEPESPLPGTIARAASVALERVKSVGALLLSPIVGTQVAGGEGGDDEKEEEGVASSSATPAGAEPGAPPATPVGGSATPLPPLPTPTPPPSLLARAASSAVNVVASPVSRAGSLVRAVSTGVAGAITSPVSTVVSILAPQPELDAEVEAPPAEPGSPPRPEVVDTPEEATVRAWLRQVLLGADDMKAVEAVGKRAVRLREQLRSGLVLCAVLNALQPRSVGRVRAPAATATRFAKLEPLQQYKRACHAAGLTERDTLPPDEWLDGDTYEALYDHLSALCRIFPKAPRFTPPGGARRAPTRGGAGKLALAAAAAAAALPPAWCRWRRRAT